MPEDHESQSWKSFAVGYRSALDTMTVNQRSVMLKAICERSPGFPAYLCRDIRERAFHALAGLSPKTSISGDAKWIEEEAVKYASRGGWLHDREFGLPENASELRRLQFDHLSTNGGVPLAWRQILKILQFGC